MACMPNVVLELPTNIRAAYHHYPYTPLLYPTSCMHLVAHNHACPFYFPNLSSQNTGKYMYMYSLKISIPHPFSRSSISNPLLTATQYFWPWVTPHKPLFDFYHYQFRHLFPLSFLLLHLPGHPHILSQSDVKPIKQSLQLPIFNIFERIQWVPQQSEGPYLKEM